MPERNHLDAKYRTATDATHGHGHPAVAVDVASRLWPIWRSADHDWMWRCGRQVERLWLSFERRERCTDLLEGGACLQTDRDRLRVSIDDRNPVGMRADGNGVRGDTTVRDITQNLAGLALHLFFFIGDVGDDVAENIHRGNARIACARHRLHRR